MENERNNVSIRARYNVEETDKQEYGLEGCEGTSHYVEIRRNKEPRKYFYRERTRNKRVVNKGKLD